MRHLSLFAGIGGFDLGFERAGMVTVGQVENDAKCVSVLERWWPDVRRWNDVRTFDASDLQVAGVGGQRQVMAGQGPLMDRGAARSGSMSGSESNSGGVHGRTARTADTGCDVVSGGFPCQDVSVAGKRAGLAGERSGLWWEFHRILAEILPAWAVVENVPGLLSSNRGRDFATILGGLGELGYGVAWRVLDAQWFGVAQRRRRVFIVGHLGDLAAVEVLDLAQGCSGDTPPSRTAGPAVAALTSCGLGGGGPDDNLAQAGHVIPFQLRGRQGGAMPEVEPDGIAGTLRGADGGSSRGRMVAFAHNQRDEVRTVGDLAVAVSAAQSGTHRQETLLATSGVRRLTPVECSRLQGFPDNWNDHLADTHRYRQYGNAVCVPVAEWVGRRIMQVGR
jgi:DNA (cytosine-5)-methyltransferase 1